VWIRIVAFGIQADGRHRLLEDVGGRLAEVD
jgi:hypothetical protein